MSSPTVPSPTDARPPRRFRRRMLAAMLAVGLLPLAGFGLATYAALGRFLSVSLAPLEDALDRASSELDRRGAPRDASLDQARLFLAQAELARQALARRGPPLFLGGLLVAAALFTGVAVLLGRSLARPIALLTDGMLRYARGDLSHQVPEPRGPGGDELHFLIQQFNRMGGELEAQRERLKVTEQLAAWQEVARALAHELKNPLTAMRMALARMERAAGREGGDAGGAVPESLALLKEEVEVLMRMAQSFSDLARLPPASPERLDLGPLLEEVCALYQHPSNVPVTCERTGELLVRADPHQLRRAFGNLIKNAVEASGPQDGPVRVEARAEGNRVRVLVIDGGPGIGQTLEGGRLPGTVVSTKPGGSGLGLPISQKILHDHGGTLRLEPLPGRGTRAVVELPVLSMMPGA